MSYAPLLLDVLACAAVLSAILVITAKNPVLSVVYLIAVFLNVAGYLVLLGMSYLALVYIIVYVGAIAILFLFVIMMMNLRLVELLDTGTEYTQSLPLGTVLGGLFFFELLSLTPLTYKDTGLFSLPFYAYTAVNTVILSPNSSHIEGAQNNEGVHTAYHNAADTSFTSYSQMASIANGLYAHGSLLLAIVCVILLLSMVGPIVLCLSPNASNASIEK